MNLKRVGTVFDDLLYINGVHNDQNPWSWIEMYLHRIKLLDTIQEITDPAELPEYLTDEDPVVVEIAATRLEELTGE